MMTGKMTTASLTVNVVMVGEVVFEVAAVVVSGECEKDCRL